MDANEERIASYLLEGFHPRLGWRFRTEVSLPQARWNWPAALEGDPKFPARLASFIAELAYRGLSLYCVEVWHYHEGDYSSSEAQGCSVIKSVAAYEAWLARAHECCGLYEYTSLVYYTAPADLS